jgi:hypothetical protein
MKKPISTAEKACSLKPAKNAPSVRKLRVGSREANRVAAAILEVLAGVRTPTCAAEALAISLPRYYQWEERALEGLLSACEPRPLGRVQTSESRIAALEKELQRWRQESARQQALVRAAQRSIGLTPPPAHKPAVQGSGKKGRQRRPTVRALKVVRTLQAAAVAAASDSSGASSASGLQPASVASVVQG